MPEGGYTLVRKWLLEALLAAYREESAVTPRTVLVFLWLLEERAMKARGASGQVSVLVSDIEEGLGLRDKTASKRIRAELRTLHRLGLIAGEIPRTQPFERFTLELPVSQSQVSFETEPFSRDSNRYIPLQRSVVRALTQNDVRGSAAIVAVYLSAKVLSFWEGHECRSGENVRIDEAASATGLSRRTIEKHLSQFESLGWVSRTRRRPWVERELGVWVVLELDWSAPEIATCEPEMSVTGPRNDSERTRVRTSKEETTLQREKEEKQQQARGGGGDSEPPKRNVVVSSSRGEDQKTRGTGKVVDLGEKRELIEELSKRGVLPGHARRLAGERDSRTIREVLEYFDAYTGNGKTITNPGGWIATLIRDGFQRPEGFRTKSELEAEAKDRSKREAHERAKTKARELEERERAEAVTRATEEYLGSLPEDEREAVIEDALRSSPLRARYERGAELGTLARAVVESHVMEILDVKAASRVRDPNVRELCRKSLQSVGRAREEAASYSKAASA